MSVVIAPTQAFNDTAVTARTFGVGDATRLVWNLAGQDSNRAILMPVLYKQDWSGISQYYSTARTNLNTQSQTFSAAGWDNITYPVTISVDSTVAPDGTTTADTITANAGSASHALSKIPSATAGQQYTISCYIKAGTSTYAVFGDAGDAVWRVVGVNMSTGVLGTPSNCTATLTALDGGWYRITATFTRTNGGTLRIGLGLTNIANPTTFTSFNAAGTESVIGWGFQVETGSVATPYIPTTTASVTVTDYSVDATGKVTFATAPASGVPLMYKEPHLPSSNVYRHFGVGDGSSVNFSLPFAPATPLIYKRDWAGNQLMYATSRTNLCLQSQTLGTTWTSPNARILANSITAPDGTLTADSVQEDNSGSAHRVSQSVTVGSATHTFSVYVKAGTRTWCLVVLDGSNSCYVNLATGAVGTVQGATPVVTSVGNGWYRVSISASVSGALPLQVYLATGNGVITYAGDNTSLIYVWGAQLETGSTATPYIPTTTVAVAATDYTLDAAGRGDVTFASAPASGAILSWTGTMGPQR